MASMTPMCCLTWTIGVWFLADILIGIRNAEIYYAVVGWLDGRHWGAG
jgi:hypothetical protein